MTPHDSSPARVRFTSPQRGASDARMRTAASTLLLLGSLAAQAASTPEEWMDPRRRFAVTLPEGWRALTPDEGRMLAASPERRLPLELAEPAPPHVLVFGAVDRWLASGFDGQGLVVAEQPGEPELGPAGVDAIAAHWEGTAEGPAPRYTVEAIELGAVGAEAHPAILARLRATDGSASWLRFDAYVPTAGDTLIFGLRQPASASREDAAAEGAAVWARIVATIKISRAARGNAELGNRLLWAVLLGLGVGLILHTVRKRQRK